MQTLAVIASIAVSLLVSALAAAQTQPDGTVPDGFPARLNIGDIGSVREWAVTNGGFYTYAAFTLSWTDTNGNNRFVQRSVDPPFYSFAKFEDLQVAMCMRLLDIIRSSNNIASTIVVDSDVTYLILNNNGIPYKSYWPLMARADVGPISGITSNSFRNLPFLHVAFDVKGLLDRFEIHSEAPLQYTFIFTNGVSYASKDFGTFVEYTTNNIADINHPFLFATNRIRFVWGYGQTIRIYTQHGDMLNPPILNLHPGRLDMTIPKGADIEVLTSTDMINWSTYATIPWSKGTNFISIPVEQNGPRRFFKARAF